MGIFGLIISFILSLVFGSFHWSNELSRFELERRSKKNKQFERLLKFRELYPGLLFLARTLSILFASLFALFAFEIFGWALGLLILFLSVFFGWLLTRVFREFSRQILERNLVFFLRYFDWCNIFSHISRIDNEPQIASVHELLHVIENGDFIDETEKTFLLNSVKFREITVKQVMIPRSEIAFVHAKDELTPLFIDELFESGHKTFPVVNKDLDHVIGLLDLDDFREISSGEQETITDKMRKVASPIDSSSTLTAALETFAKSNATTLMVAESDKIVGLLSLSDVLNKLF